jgi:hypothetical protein
MKPMIRFQIEIETSWSNPGYRSAQGYLPFFFRARDLAGGYASIAFGVLYGAVELEYENLSRELGDTLRKATIRWAIPKIEESLLSGAVEFLVEPIRETRKLVLDHAELGLIKKLVAEKTCEYQTFSGRDLFCSAATLSDETVVGQIGLRRLAPTSRPMCRACNMPDTDYVCSYLAHPGVIGMPGHSGKQRQLVAAYCEIGQREVESDPSECHAGGHKCWVRVVSPAPEPAPLVLYLPRELPTALDFLNTIWEKAFGHRLLRLRSVEKTAALSLDCATHEEFRAPRRPQRAFQIDRYSR